MERELKLSLLFFCSQIAVLLVASLQNRNEKHRSDYRLFMVMVWVIGAELVFHSLIILADGALSRLGRTILSVSLFFYNSLSCIVTMTYAIYVEYTTFSKTRRPRKRILLYLLPAFAIICLSFLSLFNGWFFLLDEDGYARYGRFMYVPIIFSFGYLIQAVGTILRRRNRMNSRDFASLVSFPVPIFVLGSLQSFFLDHIILLPGQILSLLILYSNIQERRLTYDHLTEVYNRKRLDEYLEAIMGEARKSGRIFSAILGDVNDFKKINDSFGHTEGDQALIAVAGTLKASLRRNDFLARYAGDEFVAILPDCPRGELEKIMARIGTNFSDYSAAHDRYALSVSVGGAVFDAAVDRDPEALIKRLDGLMYADKKRRKG